MMKLRPHDTTDYKMKIDISCFNGHMDIENFFDWVEIVDKFMDYMQIPEQ